jgi:tetratricopeptide (TPR) repeat protein
VSAGIAALLVVTPLIPSESVAEGGSGLYLNMLWLVLLAVWSVACVIKQRATVRVDATLGAVVLFAGIVAASGWLNLWEGNPRATINSVWQWVSFAVVFFLVRQTIVSRVEQRAIVAVMIALAVALSMYAYYQYFVSFPQMRAQLAENPQQAFIDGGLGVNPDPQTERLFRNRVGSLEPIATFALTNSLAGFLAPWLVLAAGIGLQVGISRIEGRNRVLAGIVLTLLVIGGCLFLTKSRAAWLATFCGMSLLAYLARRGAKKVDWRVAALAGVATTVLLATAVAVGGVDIKVLSEAPKSLLYRLEYWQATAAMIRDHALWGVGVGNFQAFYTAYKLPQASESVADPHNFLLEIWASAGIFALMAFTAVFVLLLRDLQDASPQKAPLPDTKDLARAEKPDSSNLGSPRRVYLGAAAGFLLAFPIALAAQYPLDSVMLWIGFPAALVCIALLHPWTCRGSLSSNMLLAAIFVLAVNLLAAGGIGFASVATNLWLWAALAQNAAEAEPTPRIVTPRLAAGLAAAAFALAGWCYFTAYGPTLTSNAHLRLASDLAQQGRLNEAEEALRVAAKADPYSAQPWSELANLMLEQWRRRPSPEKSVEFQRSCEEAVKRDARSFTLWKAIGEMHARAYHVQPDSMRLDAAVTAFQQAIKRYPVNAALHVELAWRLHLSQRPSEAAKSAETALQLDQLNPHAEYKLAVLPAPEDSNAENLEQLAQKLRKLKTSASIRLPE